MMKILPKLPQMATLLFVLFFSSSLQANTIYVDGAAIGANNGSSWVDAYVSFQDGINAAVAGDEVWVATGTYQPAFEEYFAMKSGVKIYGGFANTATLFSERNWIANPVILLGNGTSVIFSIGVDADATLDGFTVTGGTQSGGQGGGVYNVSSSPVFANIIFSGNSADDGGQGGAVYNNSSSSIFINTVFSGNSANGGGQGGAVYDAFSSTTFINSVFSGNSANDGFGGAVLTNGSAITFTNVTFFGNTAMYNAAGIYSLNSPGAITNCIFWNNTILSGANPDLFISGTPPTVAYSFAKILLSGTGNLSGESDPFVNIANPAGADGIFMTADDGLQLLGCQTPLNAGDNAANISATDITGQPRIYLAENIDMGAYEYQAAQAYSLAMDADSIRQMIEPLNILVAPGSCRLITALLPNGANPAADSVTTKVWIDNSVQSYAGQFYAQRHYDITLRTDAAIATAKVFLFFTQAEFDAFNALSVIDLPADPADAAGIANLRIKQFHGESATGTPGTYSGSTVTIDPDDVDIFWSSFTNSWQVSFDVTGFSGFFVTTDPLVTLPLTLLSFTGQLVNGKTQLQWKTANEINTHHFEVQESSDGMNFNPLATVMADGRGDNSYSSIDAQTQTGNNYYRLKSVDNDGKFTYSKVVLIKISSDGKSVFSVYPNPTAKQLVVQYDNTNSAAQISIYSLQGQKILNTSVKGSTQTTIDVSHLARGTYMIEYRSDTEIRRDKFVKID
jgi:Secretion system C-terminal sorting domain